MSNKIITVDVREHIRGGREPFAKIMSAASALRSDEDLRLIAPFEPVPLFHVLARQGFQHSAQAIESGDWEVLFTRDTQGSLSFCSSRREEAQTSCSITAPATDQSLLTSAATVQGFEARNAFSENPLPAEERGRHL